MSKALAKKLVYRYPDGRFYIWRGENLRGGIIHRTKSINEAADFSGLMYPEKDGSYEEGGELVWYGMAFTELSEYKAGDTDSGIY